MPVVVVAVTVTAPLVAPRRRSGRVAPPPPPPPPQRPAATSAAATAAEAAPAAPPEPVAPRAPTLEVPEPTAGRLLRLRARLARPQNPPGHRPLARPSPGKLDGEG